MTMNYRQIKAIEASSKARLLKMLPELTENSGIYVFSRVDEEDIKYAYVGQAKHLLTRLAQHLTGYQHIDLSIKKHGLYEPDKNPFGYQIHTIDIDKKDLDKMEKYYIKVYADNGYQLRNKTSGGQGEGKKQIDDYKPAKTYRDGLKQGYKNASKEISHLFEKHLYAAYRGDKTPSVNQQKAMKKFDDFLKFHKEA